MTALFIVGGLLALVGGVWLSAGAALLALGFLAGLRGVYVAPPSVAAWAIGALGEEQMGVLLAPLASDGFVLLHDLQVPGRRENIDHLLIGPPGVVVVETKNYGGRVWARRGELFVNGSRKNGFLDQVERQRQAVSRVLELDNVYGYICVTRARFPMFGDPIIRGITVLPPNHLLHSVRSLPATNDALNVERIARLAAERFRPARLAPANAGDTGAISRAAQTDFWVRNEDSVT